MVDSEPKKRPLTPEVVDDVGAGFGAPGDNHLHTHQQEQEQEQEQEYRSSPRSEGEQEIHRVDHQRNFRSIRGGGGATQVGEEGNEEANMRHMEHGDDDPHGNAAMALTALSCSMRELYRSRSSRSESQGFTERQFAATESGGGGQRSQTEGGGGSATLYYSQTQNLRETQETFIDASLGGGEGSRQQQQQPQPLALQLPLSAAMTPSSSSSALNTSTLAASESTSPFSAQEDVTSRDTVIIPQGQFTPHVPGERMQTLSHMLEDRLSLASFSTERSWGNIECDLPEHSMGNAMSSGQYSRDDEQQHHEYHGILSPSPHPGDFLAHSSQFISERLRTPPTPSTALQREHGAIRRHQWGFSHESQSRHQQQQHNFQALSQNQQHPHHRRQPQEQHHHSQSSIPMRDDRDSPHWMTQVSPSSTESAIVVKPKRKYTKKSSLLPQSIIESRDQVEFQSKQRSNELLFSDRGLILKTQIPKKGRPISKHSTTSSQSTPTLNSLGILPASHHYFTKTGTVVASSSASSVKSGLVAAAAAISGRNPSDPALNTTYASSSQGVEHRGGSQRISPTGRRPGRPPTNPSLSRYTHSQSCSSPSSSSTSFPPPSASHSGQSRPILSPTTPEFDLHSSVPRYTDRHSQRHGLDDTSWFSTYRDRSPTLSVATTASSSQLSHRHQHQYSDQQRSSSSSHRRYVSSPIDQEFSGEEFECYEENDADDDASIYPGRRRRTVDNPSSTATIMSLRSFGEGVPTQMNTLKRSSSGMQKSLSMDGYHSRPVENRRRMSVGGGGGRGSVSGGRGSMGAFGYGYGTAEGQFEDVNEEIGSNFYDDGFDDDDAVNSQRSRKRISGSDLDYSRLVDTAGGIGGGSSQRRAVNVHQGGNSNSSGINKTRHEGFPESERCRPRSLVLPRGRGELALPWTSATTMTAAMLDSGSGSGSGSGSMVGELSGGGQHQLDIDDDEVSYREMMIMTPAIAPASQSQPLVPSGSSSRGLSTMMRGIGTRGKGHCRGAGARGRSTHSHARSLDISFITATPSSHRDGSGGSTASHLGYQHRAAPISFSSSLEHHLSRNDTYSSEDMLPDRGDMLSSSRHRVYESSTSSLSSPPFGDTFISTGSDKRMFDLDTQTHSGTDQHYHHQRSGYNDLDTPTVVSTVVTKADLLAREMSGSSSFVSGSAVAPSGSGIGRGGSSHGRGRGRGRGHHHHSLKAAVVKRSVSKRGPGPHLKKHQILQQQLHQIQQDQEELDLQMAMQQQQQQQQKQQQQKEKKEKEKEQQRQSKLQHRQQEQEREWELQMVLRQQQEQQQQGRPPSPAHTNRHQHSQSLQLEQEFAPHTFQQAHQHQQQHQNQPRPGRPTKQRVLLRSESAFAVLHGLHSPPSGSSLSQSQSQLTLPLASSSNTSTLASASAPTTQQQQQQQQPTTTTTTSRRRQNQQQPILLRPVSLPSLTSASNAGHASGSNSGGTGGGGRDSWGSPPYMMNHPPPGQPLFRSLHAPYLVSPSSLVSVASNASSSSTSTGTTGAGIVLANAIGNGRRGRGRGGVVEGEEETDDVDDRGEDGGEEDSSPVIKSPYISYVSLATTPPLVGSRRMFTPPYTTGGSQHSQEHLYQGRPIHHHHPYQRSHQHSSGTSIHQHHHHDLKRSSHPGATTSHSNSSSRGGGISASSSGNTLVHLSSSPFTSQTSLHHQQHRHSSSLPSLSYYQTTQGMSSISLSTSTSTDISSLSTSPQHNPDYSKRHHQQRKMSNPPPLLPPLDDPTPPPIHRMVSHDPPPLPAAAHKLSSSTTSTIPNTTNIPTTALPPQQQSQLHEESVERLMIRTPLGEVRRPE